MGKNRNASAVSAYYHFASDGSKFQNKWDKFDVDKELAKLDKDESAKRKKSPAQVASASQKVPVWPLDLLHRAYEHRCDGEFDKAHVLYAQAMELAPDDWR